MTQVRLIDSFIPTKPTAVVENEISFKLHTVILLVGPRGSGKTEFTFECLFPELKRNQTGEKNISISYIGYDHIAYELLDRPELSNSSKEFQQITEQIENTIFDKLRVFSSYPVNSDFIIIDSTGLNDEFRAKVLEVCDEQNYNVSALTFDYEDKSQYYIKDASGLKSETEKVSLKELKDLRRAMSNGMPVKLYTTINKIKSRDFGMVSIQVEDYEKYDQYFLPQGFEYVIIGDIHGCKNEFIELIQQHGFTIGPGLKVTHPENKRIVLVGDLVDKGYAIKEVVEIAYANIGYFHMVMGNHESFVYRVLKRLIAGDSASELVKKEFFNSIEIFEKDEELREKFFAVFEAMKGFLVHRDFIVTHSPTEKKYLGKLSNESLKKMRDFKYPKTRDFEDFSEFISEFDSEFSFMMSEASDYQPKHVFGHVVSKEVSIHKNKIAVDTGCASGGKLSSVIIRPSGRVIINSVDSIKPINQNKFYNFFANQ